MLNYILTCIYEHQEVLKDAGRGMALGLDSMYSIQKLLCSLSLFLYKPIVSPESNFHLPR